MLFKFINNNDFFKISFGPEKVNYINYIYIYLIALLTYLILFNHVFIFPFMIHDEYRFFQPLAGLDWPHCCAGEVVADHYRFGGRFIAAEIMNIFGKLPIQTIDDLKYIRVTMILFLALCPVILTIILDRMGLNFYFSVISSVTIFLLPGYTVAVTWLMSAPVIVSVIFALIASLFSLAKIKNVYKIILIFSLLLMSLQTYPSSTPAFYLPLIFLLLFNHKSMKDLSFYFISTSVIYVSVYIFYFITHKIILKLTSHLTWASPNKLGFNITNNIFHKMNFFLETVTPKAFNLWIIKDTKLYLIFLLLICIACFLKFLIKSSTKVKQALTLFIIIAVILLANVQNILPSVDFIQFRTLTIYQSIIVVLLIWSIGTILSIDFFKLKNNFIISSTILFIFGLLFQTKNINNNIQLSYLEYKYLKTRIIEHLKQNENIQDIYITSIVTNTDSQYALNYRGTKLLIPSDEALNYLGSKILIGGSIMQYPEYNYASFREEWPAYIISILREIAVSPIPITAVCDANHQPERCKDAIIRVAYNGYVGRYSELAKKIFLNAKTLHVDMTNLKRISDIERINSKILDKIATRNIEGFNFNNKKNLRLRSLNDPILYIENYKNTKINIILYKDIYYSFPQDLKEFTISKFDKNTRIKGVYKSKTLSDILNKL